MGTECPPARLSHVKYVRTESSKPPQLLKKELNRSSQTRKVAERANTACFQFHSASRREGLAPFGAVQRAVATAANPMAARLRTNVSLVAYISPSPAPASPAQPAERVCV